MGKFSRKTKIKILGARPVLAISVMFALGCVAGLGYLWQIKQIYALGVEIKASELRFDEVRQRKLDLEQAYAVRCSRRELTEKIRSMKLGLEAPSPDTLVRLSEPPLVEAPKDGASVLARSGAQSNSN
jgi:hypothetical protein